MVVGRKRTSCGASLSKELSVVFDEGLVALSHVLTTVQGDPDNLEGAVTPILSVLEWVSCFGRSLDG